MNIEAQKLELIDWILKMKDASIINDIKKLKNAKSRSKTVSKKNCAGKTAGTPLTIEELHKYTASSKISWAGDISNSREDRI
ncbi:MAG: hypothetical protein KAT34_13800 [Candidatus Aminicenantes bacterium]|nr:hypothetical protein [Candidatus Aminicenantes bacterium]